VDLKGRSLRIVFPVNVRGGDGANELGNQISFVPVPLPLDVRDPQKLLAVVRERVEILKRAHAAELVGLLGGVLSTFPSAFWAKVGPVASQLPISLCNIICTNVPGPQMPLYLMGHKMLKWYPWVPIGGLMGINCAILTYNGTAYFGFTGDVGAAPDLERLEKFVDESFAALRAGAVAEARGQAQTDAEVTPQNEAKPGKKRRTRPNAKIPLAKPRAVRRKSAAESSSFKQTESAPPAEHKPEREKALVVEA